MPERMVRKQIYLPRRQDALLKKLASQRGVSEAEGFRQALEREARAPAPASPGRQSGALGGIFAFVETLKQRPEFMAHASYTFQRQDLYAERESRLVRDRKGEP